jgi:hypothetical protein
MTHTEVPTLAALKYFDVSNATTALWAFKKSMPTGRDIVFTGRWIQTTDALADELKSAIESEIERITEVQEYGLLTETNEAGALTISTIETNAGLIVQQAAADVSTKRANKLKDIQNSAFYATKLVSGDTVLYGVKKTDFSWRTSKSITAFWRDTTLDVSTDPSFDISPSIDFFILNDAVIISQKRHFESILNYKDAHKDDFVELQAEPEFQAVFSCLASLTSYVGDNKMQLRRASAIRQKGHYKDDGFMQRLRARHKEFGLKLNFDNGGKIIPSPETCRDIFQALLDHRLTSAFSMGIYDVPDASRITV